MFPEKSDNGPRWPMFQINSCHHAANLYLLPGIQAPGLIMQGGMITCCITNMSETVGPGVGTLFQESFDNPDHAHAVSAAAMRMDQQTLRLRVLERLIEETMRAHETLLQALAALKTEDIDRYVSLCHDAEIMANLLATRTSWLTGIIAIMGGPEDPLARYPSGT
jgi:hypothetical protein